tara:strand:+ start:2479 stop:2907 length:429 start_codon:yes stop_codon:yes gene_type:complete
MTDNNTKITMKDLPAEFYMQIITELHNCIMELRKAFINVPGKHGTFFKLLADGVMHDDYKHFIFLTQALQFHTSNDPNSGVNTQRRSTEDEQMFVEFIRDELKEFHNTLESLDDDAQDDLLKTFGFTDSLIDQEKEEVRHEA